MDFLPDLPSNLFERLSLLVIAVAIIVMIERGIARRSMTKRFFGDLIAERRRDSAQILENQYRMLALLEGQLRLLGEIRDRAKPP